MTLWARLKRLWVGRSHNEIHRWCSWSPNSNWERRILLNWCSSWGPTVYRDHKVMKCKYEMFLTGCVYLQDASITFSTLPEFFSFSTDSQSSTKKKNMFSVWMSQTITCCRNQDGSRPGKYSRVFVVLKGNCILKNDNCLLIYSPSRCRH